MNEFFDFLKVCLNRGRNIKGKIDEINGPL